MAPRLQSASSKSRRDGRRYAPYVFTGTRRRDALERGSEKQAHRRSDYRDHGAFVEPREPRSLRRVPEALEDVGAAATPLARRQERAGGPGQSGDPAQDAPATRDPAEKPASSFYAAASSRARA
jgi:hypothetical protein